jgi:hypothetical protein
MLTILGEKYGGRFCDGLSRRSFLRIGGLALGGMGLPEILRAESGGAGEESAPHGSSSSQKAVIMVFLPGGPPHQDMWDLKMDAPSDVRGEFRPIQTSVPGIEICELFPRIARMFEKFVAIRSIVGATGDHYSVQCFSGRSHRNPPPGGWPCIGSVLSKVGGPVHPGMPPFVGLSPKMGHTPWADNGQPGFLGVAHAPFKPNGDGAADMVLQGVTLERLRDRKSLLTSFDRFRRDCDQSGMMEGLDAFHRQAFGVLTSSRLAEALDLEREDPKVRERYGFGVNKLRDDGGPRTLTQFLLARRLVEAGVRCVTLSFSRWDWHGSNFAQAREDMPALDQAVSALVQDLEQRGLDKDVSVVVWGEFGRTPKINNDAGRDHWPQVSCALLAGGGMRTGQVIGATNRLGEYAKERPVQFQEVFATLYHSLGLGRVTVNDLSGRPRHLVDSQYEPMAELV